MRQAQNSPEKAPSRMPVLRIEPEKRLCPAFDPVTIATFPVAEPDEMGFRVLDNFCARISVAWLFQMTRKLPFSRMERKRSR